MLVQLFPSTSGVFCVPVMPILVFSLYAFVVVLICDVVSVIVVVVVFFETGDD